MRRGPCNGGREVRNLMRRPRGGDREVATVWSGHEVGAVMWGRVVGP